MQGELIKKDNLARGKLLETAKIYGYKDDQDLWYKISSQELISKRFDSEPVEYWGTFKSASSNYVSDTDSFPWMKVKISEDKEIDDLPF